jgi:hypothetical protein
VRDARADTSSSRSSAAPRWPQRTFLNLEQGAGSTQLISAARSPAHGGAGAEGDFSMRPASSETDNVGGQIWQQHADLER